MTFIILAMFSFVYAQVTSVEVLSYEQALELPAPEEKLDLLSEQSKQHVSTTFLENVETQSLELLDIEVEVIDEKEKDCYVLQNLPKNDLTDFSKILDFEPKKRPRKIYFTWGYNRNFHTKSDATFMTNDGTFTIKDAIGHDRPSKNWKDYVYPTRIPIPQYNLRVGYEINDHWELVAGLDHMKWVFDNQVRYEVEGNYDHTVFVPHDSDPHQLVGLNFDQVKETGDMRWLYFDHTNGYNYAHLGGVYKKNLWQSRNQNWKLETGVGLGAGLMIPQTTVKYHQDSWWNFDGVDNNFHIAGFGGHAETKLIMSFKNFFVQPEVRGTYIKINNALVQKSGEKLEHTPIGSVQFIFQGGYKIPIKERKKRVSSTEF